MSFLKELQQIHVQNVKVLKNPNVKIAMEKVILKSFLKL